MEDSPSCNNMDRTAEECASKNKTEQEKNTEFH